MQPFADDLFGDELPAETLLNGELTDYMLSGRASDPDHDPHDLTDPLELQTRSSGGGGATCLFPPSPIISPAIAASAAAASAAAAAACGLVRSDGPGGNHQGPQPLVRFPSHQAETGSDGGSTMPPPRHAHSEPAPAGPAQEAGAAALGQFIPTPGVGPVAKRSGPNATAPPAAPAGPKSLLLKIFRGLFAPDAAALVAAAAQRALVTPASLPPGLYFKHPKPAATAGQAAGGGGGRAPCKKPAFTGGGPGFKGRPPSMVPHPFASLYEEAARELMGALDGSRPLPRRTAVERITDRCHPCFRNPFEGLRAVKERRKLVARAVLPEGCLLGAYSGEGRTGKLDERLVGGDLSGLEGIKAGFTLTLWDSLDWEQWEAVRSELGLPALQPAPAQALARQGSSGPGHSAGSSGNGHGNGGGGGCSVLEAARARDSLVVVGDPATCALAEANAPRWWDPCSKEERRKREQQLKQQAAAAAAAAGGGGSAPAPAVPAAAVCNCKAYKEREANAASVPCVLKVRLSRLRAAAEAEQDAVTLQGLEALRAAAADAAATGGGGAEATGEGACVYALVSVMVTSRQVPAGAEVLTHTDADDSFFSVADQNQRQYDYIHGVTKERDALRDRTTLLTGQVGRANKARKAAETERDAAREALVTLESELAGLRRQRDEAAAALDAQRAASAAMAAAAGPRMAELEREVSELRAEKDRCWPVPAEVPPAQAQGLEGLEALQPEPKRQRLEGEAGAGSAAPQGTGTEGIASSAVLLRSDSSAVPASAAAAAGAAAAAAFAAAPPLALPTANDSTGPHGTELPPGASADAGADTAVPGAGGAPCEVSAALARYAACRREEEGIVRGLAAELAAARQRVAALEGQLAEAAEGRRSAEAATHAFAVEWGGRVRALEGELQASRAEVALLQAAAGGGGAGAELMDL
ncbi:hypothetical protein HYH03_014750 [Edaphochlamys debaryana]|uniref:Uncharacterized protein n=1 Tax=Edaphochlamys debaryana TaxID=47281 RepID=A0A836BRV7_9CHLO|nr:hypothetical protein HYH03_014750 [Edaphochlamys debaryana]|eukprot:KAG2486580.1 hypothetical protein HYH03_014750 [Edaphochlamys debaryana]